VKVFGTKFKKAVGSSIKFLFELLEPGNFAELDRQIYEMNNPFRLKDYEFLLSAKYKEKGEYVDCEVCSILEDLRKKAGISGNIVLGKNESLEDIIRRLVPPTSKEKVEYIKALREAASGKLDVRKYQIRNMVSNVVPGTTLKKFSITSSDGKKEVIYDLNKGIGTEDIDFKRLFRYRGVHDSEVVEEYRCRLYEPTEEKECKNPQKKCKNCSVYHGFKGNGRL
jgi:hypothetical protein